MPQCFKINQRKQELLLILKIPDSFYKTRHKIRSYEIVHNPNSKTVTTKKANNFQGTLLITLKSLQKNDKESKLCQHLISNEIVLGKIQTKNEIYLKLEIN